MSCIGDRLKMARVEKGLTQEQLAVLCDTSQGVIRNYEKSRRFPSIEMLVRFCDALKVSPDYLLQDELSFNPYAEKDELFTSIHQLTPKQTEFLKEILVVLRKH